MAFCYPLQQRVTEPRKRNISELQQSPRERNSSELQQSPRSLVHMRKPQPKPSATQDGKSCRGHVRYGIRIGRITGNFRSWFGAGQAEEQVHGMHACHMGFSQAMVDMNLHHKYLQGHYGSDQIKKLKRGMIPAGEPAFVPAPYSYYDVDAPPPSEEGGEPSAEHAPAAP